MDLTFVICPNLIGILSLSILLVFSRFNYYLEQKKLKLFMLAAVVNLIIVVFGLMDYLFSFSPFPSAYLFRRITTATGFALSPIFPLLLSHINSSKFPPWVYVPATVNVLISYSSIFTGHMFMIDKFNGYSRGPLFIVMLGISVFYMLLVVSASFMNLKRARASEWWLLTYLTITVFLTNMLEIFLSFHFLIWNSCAILLLCYYLFLHIQYFKYDPLTGVFSRRVYESERENLKGKRNVGIISFDLDYLKKINDKEGHERGDAYIVASAQLMEQSFSDLGRLYRVGGDEFVLFATGTTEDKIKSKLEAFREICTQKDVAVSCGYAFSPSVVNLEQLLRDSDSAMYENKRLREAELLVQKDFNTNL